MKILSEKNKVVWFSKDQRIILEEIKSLESLLCHWCSSKLCGGSSSLNIREFMQLNS